MILKLKTDAGWRYLDGVLDFQTYGYLEQPPPETGADVRSVHAARTFTSHSEVVAAVDRTWGNVRDFDAEVWPMSMHEPDFGGQHVESGVARLDGDRRVLVIWADEAFLLSEKGDTIDRLR